VRYSLLMIDANPGDAPFVGEMLTDAAEGFSVHCTPRLAAGMDCLTALQFDLILLDLFLPDSHGLATVREVLRAVPKTPVVVVTGPDHRNLEFQALSEGAQDFLVKGEFDAPTLLRALRHAIARHSLLSTLQGFALVDDLTGLSSRRGFFHLSNQYMKIARRSEQSAAVVSIDMDGLKWINDTHGHEEGNRVLIEAGRILRRCFRKSDIVGRLGGDEFVALVCNPSKEMLAAVEMRICRELEIANQSHNRPYKISFSVGMAHSADLPRPTLSDLFQLADRRMYTQKKSHTDRHDAEARLPREFVS
jgi:two-component system cell cycle response regulator